MLRKALIAAGAAALSLPMVAQATEEPDLVITAPGEQTRSIAVLLADLDLNSDHAVRVADGRIQRAARSVCDYDMASVLTNTRGYRDCYRDAFGRARVDLNQMIYQERAG